MKMLIILISVLFLQCAYAGGDNVGNGGDSCENRFQIIRNDIQSWILLGGGAGLQFPNGVTFGSYNQSMLANMTLAKISCTDQNLKIGNVEKTCLNFSNSGSPYIVCNSSKFFSTSQENQYLLVHHEYAGLSGLEVNNSEESDYRLSNQIGYYLEDQIVKKLVIKPPVQIGDDPFDPMSCLGPQLSRNDVFQKIPLPNKTSKVIGKFQIFARKRVCYENSNCQPWKNISEVSQLSHLRYDFVDVAGFNSSILTFEQVSPANVKFTGQILANYTKNEVVVSFVGDQVQTESGYVYPSGNVKPPMTFGPYLEYSQFTNEVNLLQLQMHGRVPFGLIGESTAVKGRGLFVIKHPTAGGATQMKFKMDSLTAHCAKLTTTLVSFEKDASQNSIQEEFQFVLFGLISE